MTTEDGNFTALNFANACFSDSQAGCGLRPRFKAIHNPVVVGAENKA